MGAVAGGDGKRVIRRAYQSPIKKPCAPEEIQSMRAMCECPKTKCTRLLMRPRSIRAAPWRVRTRVFTRDNAAA